MKKLLSIHPSLPGFCPITDALVRLATKSGNKERGAVFTKRVVVDFILDLIGYTSDQPLMEFRLLEPSIGNGDFILPALERLLSVAQREPDGLSFKKLAPAIRGMELHHESFSRTRSALRSMMIENGVSRDDSEALLDIWLNQGDFLLWEFDHEFTHTVGNPPYIRLEAIPDIHVGVPSTI